MTLPKAINFQSFIIAGTIIIGAFPIIKILAYIHDQPNRDREIVLELRLIRNDLSAANALNDKRISILENKVQTLEIKAETRP